MKPFSRTAEFGFRLLLAAFLLSADAAAGQSPQGTYLTTTDVHVRKGPGTNKLHKPRLSLQKLRVLIEPSRKLTCGKDPDSNIGSRRSYQRTSRLTFSAPRAIGYE